MKIENMIKKLGVPIQVFISPTRTIYRKPAPGMWQALCEKVIFMISIIKKQELPPFDFLNNDIFIFWYTEK